MDEKSNIISNNTSNKNTITNSQLSQIKSILEFLKSKKTKQTALEILLNLTETQEMLPIINKTETCKLVLRELELEDITKEVKLSALNLLVNLSSEELFHNTFFEINTCVRLARLYLSTIDKEVKIKPINTDNMFSLDLELGLLGEGLSIENNNFNEIKKNYEIKKIMDKFVLNSTVDKNNTNIEQIATIPYYLMIINNLTINELGQKQFLNVENEKLKGLVMLKMLDKYFENIYKDELDFFSSILANISALKEGRIFLLENKIFDVILAQVDKLNNFKMINMLRLFRNCCFEFEKYENNLIVKDGYMLIVVFKILLLTNNSDNDVKIDVSSLDNIYFTHFNREKAIEDKETINDLVVDLFIVLTNTEKVFPLVVKNGLKTAWNKILYKLANKDKEFEDRLFAITNFLSIHK